RDNLGIASIEELNELVRSGRRDSALAAGRQLDILVSDGGATYAQEAAPPTNWVGLAMRVINIGLSEPDEIRITRLISEVAAAHRVTGTHRPAHGPDVASWSIQRVPKWHAEYAPQGPNDGVTAGDIIEVARVSTRLAALKVDEIDRIINWGYLAAHHALPFVDELFTGD